MSGGDYDADQREMLAKAQRATRTGVYELDLLIKMTANPKEGPARNQWASELLMRTDFHPIPKFLVTSVLANKAKEYGNHDQTVRDTIRAIAERE